MGTHEEANTKSYHVASRLMSWRGRPHGVNRLHNPFPATTSLARPASRRVNTSQQSLAFGLIVTGGLRAGFGALVASNFTIHRGSIALNDHARSVRPQIRTARALNGWRALTAWSQ